MTLLFGVLIVGPMVALVYGALRTASPSLPGDWTTDGVVTAYTSSSTYGALRNSLILSITSSSIGTAGGFILAWINARTTVPLRRILTPAMVLIVALPSLFYALAWSMLGNRRVGLLNEAYRWATGSDGSPLNIYSWSGLIAIMSFKGIAFAYLLLLGPTRGLNRAIEEAAVLSGASRTRMVVTIDGPVLLPALAGVLVLELIISLESFDAPLLIGVPAGIRVFSTEVYHYLYNVVPSNYASASSLAIGLVVLIVALVVVRSRLMRGRSFSTVTGKAFRREPWDLGRWRFVWTGVVVLFVIVALILPLLQVGLGSFQPVYGLWDNMGLGNYRSVLGDARVLAATRNTVVVSLAGGFIAMAVATLIAYVGRHANGTLPARLLSAVTWLPWAVPGLTLSLAFSWSYLSIPGLKSLFGSVWLVLIALIVAALPLAARSAEAAQLQLGLDMEEAARTSGARRARSVLDVIVPLTLPSFLSGWFLAVILIAGRFDVPLLLSSSKNRMLALVVFDLYGFGRNGEAAAILCVILGSMLVVAVFVALLRAVLGVAARRFGAAGAPRLAATPH